MHLASTDICERVGDCLDSRSTPSVLGADAVQVLDESDILKGVVLSSAYLYGLASLKLSPPEVALWTRRENEFTAAEVAKFSDRLVGFLSVDPLQPSSIDELRHWRGSRELVGLKLHLTASAINVRNEHHRESVSRVVEEAAAQGLPMVIHIGGGTFDASDADIFIQTILPNAGPSQVQIAHAAGGYPLVADNHVLVLQVFANYIEQDDPITRQVFFDLSYVPAAEEDKETVLALAREIRRIGIDRFLFGSDFNVLAPVAEIAAIQRLELSDEEEAHLRTNCAPWVCPGVRAQSAPGIEGIAGSLRR